MTQYLIAIHNPDNYDPSLEDQAMHRDIDVLNDEMVAAGARVFVGGLQPASSAKSLRAQPDGKVLITDGPYLETKEHIGGFWIVEAADLNEALEWGRKAVVACRAPVEVRPLGQPDSPGIRRRRSRGDDASKRSLEEVLPRYLVTGYLPDDFDPSRVDEAMVHDIDVLNDEMVAAGVRVFVGGLQPASSAKSLRAQPDSKVVITDGPYLETKEHIGGFLVLEVTNLDEALEWGRKGVVAGRAPIEVRPFH